MFYIFHRIFHDYTENMTISNMIISRIIIIEFMLFGQGNKRVDDYTENMIIPHDDYTEV